MTVGMLRNLDLFQHLNKVTCMRQRRPAALGSWTSARTLVQYSGLLRTYGGYPSVCKEMHFTLKKNVRCLRIQQTMAN